MVEELFPKPCIGLPADRREAYERLLKLLSKSGQPANLMINLTRARHQFSIGQVTASETISRFRQSIGGTHEGSEVAGLSLDGISQLISLVVDVERRATLTLVFLSEYPLIELPCCGVPVCFQCKVKGHHKGETCEK
jgi:hypothetical protein